MTPYYVGIDIGASRAKLVVVDHAQQLLAQTVRSSGVDYVATAERCLAEALASAGLSRGDVARSISKIKHGG